jgi:hypothetical protein
VLLEAIGNIKTAIYFNSIYCEDECVATLALINYNNPYLVTKCLQILKKSILALEEPLQTKMVYFKKNVRNEFFLKVFLDQALWKEKCAKLP